MSVGNFACTVRIVHQLVFESLKLMVDFFFFFTKNVFNYMRLFAKKTNLDRAIKTNAATIYLSEKCINVNLKINHINTRALLVI